MKTGRIHMRMDERLLERVKKLARKQGLTLTQFVEAAFRSALEQEEKKKEAYEAEQI